MSRLGTKKPPVENAFYNNHQQQVAGTHGKGKLDPDSGLLNAPYWGKEDRKKMEKQ